MARVVKGPASQRLIVCGACGGKTAVPAAQVGKVRCSHCGQIRRK